jgi:hypothetical protein
MDMYLKKIELGNFSTPLLWEILFCFMWWLLFFFFMGALPLVGGSLPRVCWSFPSRFALCFSFSPPLWLVVRLGSFLPLVASVGLDLMSCVFNVVSFFQNVVCFVILVA